MGYLITHNVEIRYNGLHAAKYLMIKSFIHPDLVIHIFCTFKGQIIFYLQDNGISVVK